MNQLAITVPIGLGDIIYLKAMLDAVKQRYSIIKIKFHREIIKAYGIDPAYHNFLDEIGPLFFSEPPYVITTEEGIPFYGMVSICNDNRIPPLKPNLVHLLCKGTPLDLNDEYIVLVTKVRYLNRNLLDERILEFWNVINQLSEKYKIVILGEKQLEESYDYREHNSHGVDIIYSIYNSIVEHVPPNKLMDKTIPALGRTSPKLSQIQQDCLIMNKAKFVVTLGVGGAFCMSTAVANTIGFRLDDDSIANVVFGNCYESSDSFICKDWNRFIQHLRMHI
jgi:hypothetical protein